MEPLAESASFPALPSYQHDTILIAMSSRYSTAERSLSAAEAGERIGLAAKTVRALVRQGKLPGFDLGGRAGIRVLESDVTAYLVALRDAAMAEAAGA
jgi:excisionase family DNA binding protein